VKYRIHAFEFVHILVLFIAVTILFQSLSLAHFISWQSRKFTRWMQLQPKTLCEDYDFIMESTHARRVFHYMPLWTHIPALRLEMEFKVFERFFVVMHQLPRGFAFAKYMGQSFKKVSSAEL
jgi:hypothetical protein